MRRARGDRLRRAGRIVEEREVTEERAGTERREMAAFAMSGAADDHLTGKHDVEGLPLFALVEDDLARRVLTVMEKAGDDGELTRVQRGEQRHVAQSRQPLGKRPSLQQGQAHRSATTMGSASSGRS